MSAAIYYAYARDDIKNFTIRVELRRVTAAATTSGTTWGPRQLTGTSSGPEQDSEVWTFTWQQKVFSQHEEELYADLGNCSTVLEQKYHRDVLALRSAGGRQNRRLFSYVDSDPPPPSAEAYRQMTDWSPGPETFAGRYHGSSVRRRRGHRRGVVSRLSEQDPVLHSPSEEHRISARINSPPAQVMYIMADLSRMDSQDAEDEQQLCEVKVDDNGMVTVLPDFNVDKPPYRIESRHREIFAYRLIHTSEAISAQDKAKEVELISELYTRHATSLANDVGTCFLDPLEGAGLRVMVFGEIVSAEGFEDENLYVSTHMELPEFWQSKENKSVDVVTQISRTKSSYMHNTAHFNCPIEHELLYDNPTLKTDELPKWPRMLVQVASLDYWERHRVEGYGFLDLPNGPGKYELTVHTWRPCGSIRDKMARFFIGGTAEIADMDYIARPQDFEGTHLSRYGFRTQSSGSVTLTFNIVHQSSIIAQRQQVDDLTCSANTYRHKGFKMSMVATLDAYRKAKKSATSAMETLF